MFLHALEIWSVKSNRSQSGIHRQVYGGIHTTARPCITYPHIAVISQATSLTATANSFAVLMADSQGKVTENVPQPLRTVCESGRTCGEFSELLIPGLHPF